MDQKKLSELQENTQRAREALLAFEGKPNSKEHTKLLYQLVESTEALIEYTAHVSRVTAKSMMKYVKEKEK